MTTILLMIGMIALAGTYEAITGKDLKDLTEKLPKELAKNIVLAIRKGNLKPLKKWIKENQQEAQKIYGNMNEFVNSEKNLNSEITLTNSIPKSNETHNEKLNNSILESYAQICNIVLAVNRDIGGSFFTEGFLHSEKAIIIWELISKDLNQLVANEFYEDNRFNILHIPTFSVKIGIVDKDSSEIDFVDLNESIKRRGLQKTKEKYDITFNYISEISEYSVFEKTDEKGEGDKWNENIIIEHDIPNGAPGIENLLTSLISIYNTFNKHQEMLNALIMKNLNPDDNT